MCNVIIFLAFRTIPEMCSVAHWVSLFYDVYSSYFGSETNMVRAVREHCVNVI